MHEVRAFFSDPRRLFASTVVFLGMGVVMNGLGHHWSIAWFKHWWQIVPCYLGYVLPLALFVRGKPLWQQWQQSLIAFVPLELIGYALGTSVIADDNVIARIWGPHNFTLVMVLLVTPTPIIGNALVHQLLRPRSRPPIDPL